MLRKIIVLCLLFFACIAPVRAGVTIHYEGSATSPDAVVKILATVTAFAKKHGWKVADASATKGKIRRVIDEKDQNYEGKINGVVVHINDDCEPLYFQFGDDLFMQDYVKTQFAGATVHIQIVELLESLRPHFRKITVDDEGEYWDTHDKAVLEGNIAQVNTMIDAEKKKNPNARGPLRFETGRIADIVQ